MSDDDSAELTPLFTREQAENAFRDALNAFVGRGRRHKAEDVSKRAGVPRRLLDCYRSYPIGHPDHRPLHAGHKLSLIAYLRADFTTEWLRLADQGAFDLPDEEPDPGELAAEVSESNAKVTRMAADRNLNNDCPRELRSTGSNLMTHGAHLVAIGARARA